MGRWWSGYPPWAGTDNPAEGGVPKTATVFHFPLSGSENSAGWIPHHWGGAPEAGGLGGHFSSSSGLCYLVRLGKEQVSGLLKGPGEHPAPARGFSVSTGRGPFSAALPSRCRIRQQRRWRMLRRCHQGAPTTSQWSQGQPAARLSSLEDEGRMEPDPSSKPSGVLVYIYQLPGGLVAKARFAVLANELAILPWLDFEQPAIYTVGHTKM